MNAQAELLWVAVDTAQRGWPVFPVVPGGKRPALHSLENCPRTRPCQDGHQGWEQRATTDPDRVRRTWSSGPFNIGIPAGPAGVVVVDLDIAKPDDESPSRWSGFSTGAQVLAVLADEAGEQVPPTMTVRTPSGGMHLYFDAPRGVRLRNTTGDRGSGLGWLIDTRGWGGYVVAPGSITLAGRYEVTDDRDPAPLPQWLTRRLVPAPPPPIPAGPIRTGRGRRDRYLDAVLTAETQRVHDAPPRQRNACLYVASIALGQLVAGGSLAEHEARAVLLSAAGRHIALGAYSAVQAEKTITSGFRAGAKRPRRIEDAA